MTLGVPFYPSGHLPCSKVYNNSLILGTIFQHVEMKSDLVSCMVTSTHGFETAIKLVYEQVDEDVFSGLPARYCAPHRFLHYALAVRSVILLDKTWPRDIPVESLRNAYPNLQRIHFSTPRNIAAIIHVLRLYDQCPESCRVGDGSDSACAESPAARSGARRKTYGRALPSSSPGGSAQTQGQKAHLVGELSLYFDDIHRIHPEASDLTRGIWGLTGPNRRFRLVDLQVRYEMAYDWEMTSSSWKRMEGLIDMDDANAMAEVLQSVEFFRSYDIVAPQDVASLLAAMPSLKHLTLCCADAGRFEEPLATTCDNIKTAIRDHNIPLESSCIVTGDVGWQNIPVMLGQERAIVFPCAFVDYQQTYIPGGYFNAEAVQQNFPVFKPMRVTICCEDDAVYTSSFRVACDLLAIWGLGMDLELQPWFCEPSAELETWMRSVLDTRLTLRRIAMRQTAVGYRLLERSEELETGEEEQEAESALVGEEKRVALQWSAHRILPEDPIDMIWSDHTETHSGPDLPVMSETKAESVYKNPLILSNIFEQCQKGDLVRFLTIDVYSLVTAVRCLYREVSEDVMIKVVARRCAMHRFPLYAGAVQRLILGDPIHPANIDVAPLREMYPRLRYIFFSLPFEPGFGLAHQYHQRGTGHRSWLRLYDKVDEGDREQKAEECPAESSSRSQVEAPLGAQPESRGKGKGKAGGMEDGTASPDMFEDEAGDGRQWGLPAAAPQPTTSTCPYQSTYVPFAPHSLADLIAPAPYHAGSPVYEPYSLDVHVAPWSYYGSHTHHYNHAESSALVGIYGEGIEAHEGAEEHNDEVEAEEMEQVEQVEQEGPYGEGSPAHDVPLPLEAIEAALPQEVGDDGSPNPVDKRHSDVTSNRIVAEMGLSFERKPAWGPSDLHQPEYGLAGAGRRFKLVSLHVGPEICLERHRPLCDWRGLDAVVPGVILGAYRAVLRDVEVFSCSTALRSNEILPLLSGMPSVRDLTLALPPRCEAEKVQHADVHQAITLHVQRNGRPLRSLMLTIGDRCCRPSRSAHTRAPPTVCYPASYDQSFSPRRSGDYFSLLSVPMRGSSGRTVIICLPETAVTTSPMHVAMEIMDEWGIRIDLQLRPLYFEPGPGFKRWVADTMDAWHTVIKMIAGKNGPGYSRRAPASQASGATVAA